MPHEGFDISDMGGVVGFEGMPPDWAFKDEVFWRIFGVLVGLTACAIAYIVLDFFF